MAILRSLLLLSLSLSLAACGSSGGGDDDGGTRVSGTGTVALLVRDAPMKGLEALIVTITSAKLLGDGAPVTIFEGRRRSCLSKTTQRQ